MLLFVPWVAFGPDVLFVVFKKIFKPNPAEQVLTLYKQSLKRNPLNLNGKVVDVRNSMHSQPIEEVENGQQVK